VKNNLSGLTVMWQQSPLFLSGRKKRLRADAVDKIVTRIKQALLKEGHQFARSLSPHIFRHSAATELNDLAGFDITRELLGHRNKQNTRKYIHLSPTSYGTYMKRHPYFGYASAALSNRIFQRKGLFYE
jgi:integrase